MADKRRKLKERHIRDANVWAAMIIGFAILYAAASYIARSSSLEREHRAGIVRASATP